MNGGLTILVAIVVLATHVVQAQGITTGAIAGQVTEATTHQPLAGVRVVAAAGGRSQSAVTGRDGTYRLTQLEPGDYVVAFSVDDHVAVRAEARVGMQRTTPVFVHIDRTKPSARFREPPPAIDPSSAATGLTLDRDYLVNVPLPPQPFGAAAAAAPGARNDGFGLAVSGSTSLENRYIVDGVDTTDLTFGSVGTSVPNEFVRSIEVMTGGYGAEYGRATGGVVALVTRGGTNELRGSVFGTLAPGWLAGSARVTPVNPSTIGVTTHLGYDTSFGVELGGPIVPDRLWFYVGFAPNLHRIDYTRTINSRTDCRQVLANDQLSACEAQYADGVPDVDPKTGFYITDTIDSEVRFARARSYPTIAKLDLAITPDHQAALSILAVPSSSTMPGLYGLASSGSRASELTTDVGGRWTSKLRDDSIELEAQLAWHRSAYETGSIDPSLDGKPQQQLSFGNLGMWSGLGGESAATIRGCTDGGPNDRYPGIIKCPTSSYTVGGPGSITQEVQDRRSARIAILDRVQLAGRHELEAGIDVEDDTKVAANLYSGGELVTKLGDGSVFVQRLVKLAPVGNTDPRFDHICNDNPVIRCQFLSGTFGDPGTAVGAQTINRAAFIRDAWQPRPNLMLNMGVRYEDQRLLNASDVRDTIDPITRTYRGDTAMRLGGNIAPRIGVSYDPTGEGRAKLFAHWGRYFEAIPLDFNDRAFGRPASYVQTYSCAPTDVGCHFPVESEQLIGSQGDVVAPGIKAEYLDELVAGVQYELPSAVTVGATYQHRQLGRVVEDVSTDGAKTYIIANPGEGVAAGFDKATRDYNALSLTVARPFWNQLYVMGSYTYSRTEGNYPGSVSYDNGQLEPNLSSQFDLIELLANRNGPLAQDRPHLFKLDAYYALPIDGRSVVTLGGRLRATSGTPIGALGGHYLYGPNESFLLPRGALGRTELDHEVDVHVAYRRRLPRNTAAEVFVDVFNVYDRQGAFSVDNTYAPYFRASGGQQNANPVSGGTYEDLIWVKTIEGPGRETAKPIGRNPNFGQPTARYAPISAQLGFRVTF